MELPDLGGRAELVRRYAHLLQHFGSEIGKRPLVRQNAEFFPDRFDKDEASVARLVRRLQVHAGLDDIPLQVRLLSPDGMPIESAGSCGTGSCGSGACAPAATPQGAVAARLVEAEVGGQPGWVLNVFDAEVHHPVGLTCKLAQALASLFLAETQSATATVEAPLEVSIDLACVALGLGNLVLEGSYVYAKSCGGPSVTQLTALNVGELAIACSLFIAAGGHSGRRALAELGTTQRALLAEANEWAASNPRIIEHLASDPGQLATSAPSLGEARPWLLRLFDRPARVQSTPEPSLERALSGELGDAELRRLYQQTARAGSGAKASSGSAPNAPAPKAPALSSAERDELRALVDEALRSS
jgi:hypothetical protein